MGLTTTFFFSRDVHASSAIFGHNTASPPTQQSSLSSHFYFSKIPILFILIEIYHTYLSWLEPFNIALKYLSRLPTMVFGLPPFSKLSRRQIQTGILIFSFSLAFSFLATLFMFYSLSGSVGAISAIFLLYFAVAIKIFTTPIPKSFRSLYSADELLIETNTILPTTARTPKKELYCCICMDNISPGQSATKSVLCGHTFHQDCLECWISKSCSCPYCRRDLHRYSASKESTSGFERPASLSIFENVFFSLES